MKTTEKQIKRAKEIREDKIKYLKEIKERKMYHVVIEWIAKYTISKLDDYETYEVYDFSDMIANNKEIVEEIKRAIDENIECLESLEQAKNLKDLIDYKSIFEVFPCYSFEMNSIIIKEIKNRKRIKKSRKIVLEKHFPLILKEIEAEFY